MPALDPSRRVLEVAVSPESASPRQLRRTVFVEVQLREQHGTDSGGLFVHKARNLSTGGMFLDALVPLPVGTRLDLQFQLPGGGVYRWLAEVRWTTAVGASGGRSKHPGMGVIFVELIAGDAAALERFIGLDD